MRIMDPLAEISKPPEGKPIRSLQSLEGKRMGLLWSQHASSVKFWPVFESVAAEMLRPSETHRLYKSSSWNTADPDEIEELVRKVDYVIVGVGG
jgi:hypothetical protein